MKLNNKVYDVLKWIAMYLLPGLATLWLTLGKVWSLPYTTEIGATISAVDVFLAFILGLSKKNYQGDGTMVVNTTERMFIVLSLMVMLQSLLTRRPSRLSLNPKISKYFYERGRRVLFRMPAFCLSLLNQNGSR